METQVNKQLQDIYKYMPIKAYEGLEGNTLIANGNTHLGIEIELENYNWNNIPDTWNIIKDDSLKLNGQELVSIPIKFKFLEVELDRLIAGTTNYTTSSRCSVHVHINVRDFTEEELKVFLGLYLIFEKSLFRFSGNRWSNNYCTPLYSFPENTEELWTFNTVFKKGFENPKWFKYSALNLCPIWGGESKKYGTIEFRHMEGNLNKEKILNWCNLIVSLKIAAKKMPLLSLLEHIKTMVTTSGYGWLANEVFGNWSTLLTDHTTFKEDIESCITKTKYTLFDNKGNIKDQKQDTKNTPLPTNLAELILNYNTNAVNKAQKIPIVTTNKIQLQDPLKKTNIYTSFPIFNIAKKQWEYNINFYLGAGHTLQDAIKIVGPKPELIKETKVTTFNEDELDF